MNKRSIVIIGGHQSPAVAVIEELLDRGGWDIAFIGRKYAFSQAKDRESFEYKTITDMGIPFIELDTPRFPTSLFSMMVYPIGLISSIFVARSYLKSKNPSIVMGFGGYISVPVILAATWLHIPTVIHEQAFFPGRATRLLSRFAQKVFISWKQTQSLFSAQVQSKTELTGNPIRKYILTSSQSGCTNKAIQNVTVESQIPLLYITGGSTGAHFINQAILNGLKNLLVNYRIIHQCGDSHFHDYEMLVKRTRLLSKKLASRYVVIKYVPEQSVRYIMEHADIIVGRSGINTVIEIAILGKPAIFIPHPGVPGGEQNKNAQFLQRAGSAEIINQKDLSADKLLELIDNVCGKYKKYYVSASKSKKKKEITIHKDASFRIACILEHIVADTSNYSFH